MIDLNKIDNALKNIYLAVVAERLNTSHPFLSAVEHTTRDVWGKEIKKCINYGKKYKILTLELKNLYGTITLSEKALKACGNSISTLVDFINSEMTELLNNMEIDMGKMLFEGGEITGFDKIFQKDGSIYGVDRDKCPLLMPYIQEDFGDLTHDKLAEVIKKLDCEPDFIITTHKIKEYIGNFHDGISVLANVNCPKDTMYILNSNDFTIHQLCDWMWLEGEDGKILSKLVQKPVYTATLVKYADLMCSNLSHQAMLSGISC